MLATFLVVAVSLAYYARRESGRAEANLALARAAVDESLSSADRDPAAAGNDVPQVDELRRELLAKAESFYRAFLSQAPNSEASRRDLAFAHFRLGHIDRMLEKSDAAVGEYRDAIRGFEALASSYPANVDYRAALANAYNWLGETLRPMADEYAEAEKAYDRAFVLQQVLVRDAGPSASGRRHQQELARTHYNRGILRAMHSLTAGQAALGAIADRDFREAIRLLEPLAAADDAAAQELARAYNNLGGLIDQADTDRSADVRSLWERAIAIGERLAASDPLNRQVRVELAQYCSNAAVLLHQQGDLEAALRRGRQAVDLFEGLSRPSPSVAVLQADAHSLRGTILEDRDAVGARAEYAVALDQFARLYNDVEVRRLPSFQLRFADLLLNLAELPGPPAEAQRARQLLGRAVGVYTEMAGQVEANGSRAEVQAALDNIARVLPALPEGERMRLAPSYQRLQRKIAATTSLR